VARSRGSSTGATRSMRLPLVLDEWVETRMRAHPQRSASELLVELVHGGLRLRDGYMSIHRYALEGRAADPAAYAEYRTCLGDTFGPDYVEHLERWLEAEGIRPAEPLPALEVLRKP
jgi:hypothetical protein